MGETEPPHGVREQKGRDRHLTECSHLFTLPIEVNEHIARAGDVLRSYTLVHAIHVEVEATAGVYHET